MRRKKRFQFKRQFIKNIERRTLEKMIALTKRDYLSESLHIEPIKEGDKLWVKSDDMSDSLFNRSKENNEIVMPEAYINTALWLLDLIKLSKDNLVKDGYIYPALFCLRHYLELIIKDSIHYFKYNKGLITSEALGYDVNEHNLFNLWNSLINFLTVDNQTKRICKLIKELDELDRGSTIFRYAFNHDKKEMIVEYDYPAIMINVCCLKKRMLQLFAFFEGINSLARETIEIEIY